MGVVARRQPLPPGPVLREGTVVEGLSPASFVGGSARLQDGQIREGQRSVWASTTAPPTKDHPQLALVLVPTSTSPASTGGAAPAWVFPFNRPGAPAAGDNQALAVNTTDGSTTYDVAFALVWADGTSVTNSNSAYAFASCRQCKTVAVAFQVVLMTGDVHVAIPQNISGAVNYSCVQCLTYAWRNSSSSPSPASSAHDPTAARHAVAADRHVRDHRPGPSPRRDPHPTAGLPESDPGAGDRGAVDDDPRPGRDPHHQQRDTTATATATGTGTPAATEQPAAPAGSGASSSATTSVPAPTTAPPSPTSPATANPRPTPSQAPWPARARPRRQGPTTDQAPAATSTPSVRKPSSRPPRMHHVVSSLSPARRATASSSMTT